MSDVVAPPAPHVIVVAASVAGPGHVRAQLPCQDAYAVAAMPGGVALAVADGLGSARAGGEGARIAVEAAVGTARACADGPAATVVAMAEAARAALEGAAGDELALEDHACTLIACVLVGDAAVCAHIGDGAAVVRVGDDVAVLSGPDRDEYVNVVTPLTAADWRDHLRVAGPISGVTGIAAFTDGLERAALDPGGAAHPGFFDPLFAFAASSTDTDAARAELEWLLSGPKLSEHSDDDKTLVIACAPPPEE